jgi:inosine/xanthosine triphosphatase
MMKIAVGSLNPIKIAAARNVLRRLYPEVEVCGVQVESGVSDMPLTEEEAIAGARQRARAAQELLGAELGIGFEGGAAVFNDQMMTSGWAAAYNGDRFGIGGGGHLQLPEEVARMIREEKLELGTAIDRLIGGENTKQKAGAIGILTQGLSSRQQAYESILIYALAPFITPHWYQIGEII